MRRALGCLVGTAASMLLVCAGEPPRAGGVAVSFPFLDVSPSLFPGEHQRHCKAMASWDRGCSLRWWQLQPSPLPGLTSALETQQAPGRVWAATRSTRGCQGPVAMLASPV